MNGIDFTYLMQPPRKYTFEMPKLKQYIENICHGKVLNLFAGKTRLNVNEMRIDLSNEYKPNYVIDAYSFVKLTNMKFDTIILDPPYNIRKAREKYNGKYIGSFTKIKNEINRILNENGKIITLGYDSVGMSRCRGFEKINICLICHSGDHNDTICITEKRIDETMDLFNE